MRAERITQYHQEEAAAIAWRERQEARERAESIANGEYCPNCGSDRVSGRVFPVFTVGGLETRRMWLCDVCGEEWAAGFERQENSILNLRQP